MQLLRKLSIPIACLVIWSIPGRTCAADLAVLETGPASNAVLSSLSDGFFVRFNQPIDHIKSRLLIKRGPEIVEALVPRLQSAPDVLFARAPSLQNGNYTLHWVVKAVADIRILEGEVPFSISLSQ